MLPTKQENAHRSAHIAYTIFEFMTVAICTLAFIASVMAVGGSLIAPNGAGNRDYVEYWAAGQQLARHANPYDGAAIRKVEISAGFPSTVPTMYVPNPPSALLLMLPLGALSPVVGEFFWELLLMSCLIFSIRTIHHLLTPFASPGQHRLSLLAYAFAPVLTCLLAGQIGLFLLLGLVLFLRLEQRFPFLAGASLWFCLLKPHLFVPFGIALILWVFYTRNYKVFAGVVSALTASSIIAMLLVPHVWLDYQLMMRQQRVDQVGLPSISVLLRQHLYPHTFWIQCLPLIAGCIWSIVYFRKHREHWSWFEHGSVLMLVSVLVAPYSWFFDQAILIPALLFGLYATRSRTLVAVLALISAFYEILALQGASLYSLWYLGTAPLWLLWFLIATRPQSALSLPKSSLSVP